FGKSTVGSAVEAEALHPGIDLSASKPKNLRGSRFATPSPLQCIRDQLALELRKQRRRCKLMSYLTADDPTIPHCARRATPPPSAACAAVRWRGWGVAPGGAGRKVRLKFLSAP